MINTQEIKKQITVIRAHALNEYKESKQLFVMIFKRNKSKDDKAFIRHQSADLVRITVVVGIGALPGGTIVVAVVEMGLRKINLSILPSAYTFSVENPESQSIDSTKKVAKK